MEPLPWSSDTEPCPVKTIYQYHPGRYGVIAGIRLLYISCVAITQLTIIRCFIETETAWLLCRQMDMLKIISSVSEENVFSSHEKQQRACISVQESLVFFIFTWDCLTLRLTDNRERYWKLI